MIENIGKYYIYRHIRLDKNEPFYIGIGTKRKNVNNHQDIYSRAFDKTTRNKFWKNIINKTNYIIQIIVESDNYEFIKEKEKEFIKLYGRKNLGLGTLVNLTNGGEGNWNIICSDETREIRRNIMLGKKRSPESIEKTNSKNKGQKRSKEFCLNLSLRNKNKVLSEELKKKIKDSHFPIKYREEIKNLYLSGMLINNIVKTVPQSKRTIYKYLKDEKLLKDRYIIMRSDGLKFKSSTEVNILMNCKKGIINNAIKNKKELFGFMWYRINELI